MTQRNVKLSYALGLEVLILLKWPYYPKQIYRFNEVKSESHSVVSNSLQPHGLNPWNSPGQNTGVGTLSLLQGIFPTLGSNPGLPHCRQILYQLSHKGSPRILEWVAYPFCSGSSQELNWGLLLCRWIFYQLSYAGSTNLKRALSNHFIEMKNENIFHRMKIILKFI